MFIGFAGIDATVSYLQSAIVEFSVQSHGSI